MLYRSPLTRWFLVAVGLIAGCTVTFGDGAKWRSTTSLHWLAQAPIPLQTWGVLLIVYGLMLLFDYTRPAGYALGALVFAVVAISLLVTLHPTSPDPKNIIATAGLVDCAVFHVFSIKTAWIQRLHP